GRKQQYARLARQVLGPYRELSDDAKLVFGNGTSYGSESLLAAIVFAAEHTSTRAEFERLLGPRRSAHPSLLRSDIHAHSFRHARKRGVTWQTFRREVRRARAAIIAAQANRPLSAGDGQPL